MASFNIKHCVRRDSLTLEMNKLAIGFCIDVDQLKFTPIDEHCCMSASPIYGSSRTENRVEKEMLRHDTTFSQTVDALTSSVEHRIPANELFQLSWNINHIFHGAR